MEIVSHRIVLMERCLLKIQKKSPQAADLRGFIVLVSFQ